jgi:hypothetical protein
MSIKNKDDIAFGDKSLSNVLEDIYNNSKKKDTTINDIMQSFLMSLKGGKDIAYIGPVIKDLLDVGVKNDEQLVKVATIIQRVMNASGGDDEDALGLTDQMKEELLSTIEEAEHVDKKISGDVEEIQEMEKIMKDKGEEDELQGS